MHRRSADAFHRFPSHYPRLSFNALEQKASVGEERSPRENLVEKELDTEHHDEYRASNKNPEKIRDLISRRVIDHDHLVDSRENKYGKEFSLKQLDLSEMPKYIQENKSQYQNFLDFD